MSVKRVAWCAAMGRLYDSGSARQWVGCIAGFGLAAASWAALTAVFLAECCGRFSPQHTWLRRFPLVLMLAAELAKFRCRHAPLAACGYRQTHFALSPTAHVHCGEPPNGPRYRFVLSISPIPEHLMAALYISLIWQYLTETEFFSGFDSVS